MVEARAYHSIETRCKLARYLKDAGRFDEAMAELKWLLDDLPRSAAKAYRVDDPVVGKTKVKGTDKTRKQMAAQMRINEKRWILYEMARVQEKMHLAEKG